MDSAAALSAPGALTHRRTPRVGEIDGLRGWAALMVVFFHELQQTFWVLHPAINRAELGLFLDGPMAVYIFFVLSGDALSCAHVAAPGGSTLDRVILKRYFRLAVPILVTVLATWLLMRCGLIWNQPASRLVHTESWLGTFLDFPPGLASAIGFSLAGTFGLAPAVQTWNTFLWTMPIELFGSLLVFAYLQVFPRLRRPIATTLGAAVLFSILNTYYGLFFLGVLLAQVRANGTLDRLRRTRWGQLGGPALLVGAWLLAYWGAMYPWPAPGRTDPAALLQNLVLFHAKHIKAVMIVCGAYLSPLALHFFRGRVSAGLGRRSFGLYLTQFAVLCSFESWLIVRHPAWLTSLRDVLGIAAASILVTFVAADLASRIDEAAQRRLNRLLGRLLARA